MSDEIASYVSRTVEGGWRITGARVSLDSIVNAYWEGEPAEEIVAQFPTLTPEQVYGAIAFYLGHREEIDSYMVGQAAKWDQQRQLSECRNSAVLQRLRQMRRQAARPGGAQ
ncbi:MAG: hypothetical protein JWL69_512 [Phycisphaerales bacterium]|jgi:uncharacterized protein (DUF433 family)|nr:hypothetical protein [Phycisphaerales bacterium]MDB5355744.1 hypothetical protein [Phycisphaerales bacterium]